ncbi:MAG: hypothetical protein CML06_09610 [Pseudomonadales bacterium]|nr:hypothetical protein [Pseudomonadales bacterium]
MVYLGVTQRFPFLFYFVLSFGRGSLGGLSGTLGHLGAGFFGRCGFGLRLLLGFIGLFGGLRQFRLGFF